MGNTLPVVLHIPHSGSVIPDEFRSGFLLDDVALHHEMGLLTDHGTDVLFSPPEAPFASVVSPWSRLLVDIERFSDDAHEPMSQKGMGVFYEKTSSGQPLRNPLTAATRRALMSATYEPHHRLLTTTVDQMLIDHGHCLIVDCHSFPKGPLPYEDPELARPEICLGSDDFHTPPAVLDCMRQVFEDAGYSVGVNAPFAGALVPMAHFRKDQRVASIMIEVRRDLYIKHINFPEITYDTVAIHRMQQLASRAIHGALAHLGACSV